MLLHTILSTTLCGSIFCLSTKYGEFKYDRFTKTSVFHQLLPEVKQEFFAIIFNNYNVTVAQEEEEVIAWAKRNNIEDWAKMKLYEYKDEVNYYHKSLNQLLEKLPAIISTLEDLEDVNLTGAESTNAELELWSTAGEEILFAYHDLIKGMHQRIRGAYPIPNVTAPRL